MNHAPIKNGENNKIENKNNDNTIYVENTDKKGNVTNENVIIGKDQSTLDTEHAVNAENIASKKKTDKNGAVVTEEQRSFLGIIGIIFTRLFFKKSVIIILIILTLIWWNFFRGRPLRISPETTIYTEPLTLDGKFVDYSEVIQKEYSPQMKTDKNAARAIIKAIGTNAEKESSYRPDALREIVQSRENDIKIIYQQLGLDHQKDVPKYRLKEAPEIFNGPLKQIEKNYPGPENEEKRKAEKRRFNLLYKRKRHVLYDEKYSRNWVNENMLALDAVVEAIENAEICSWPFLKSKTSFMLADFRLPCAHTARIYARSLAFRSVWYITQGEFDKALRDRLACQKLGVLSSKSSFFIIEDLIGMSQRNLSANIPVFLDPDKRPDRKIWQRLMDEPKITSDWDHCQKILVREKCFGLNMIAILQNYSSQSPEVQKEIRDLSSMASDEIFFNYYIKLGFDWNYIAKKYNEIYNRQILSSDDFEEPAFLRSWYTGSVSPIMSYYEIVRRSLTLRSRSDLMVGMMQSYTPARSAWYGVCQRTDCLGNLQKIGCAMQLYLCDHGTLPPAFTVDSKGKPLHSWRVLLLPYFGNECAELYKKIRLTEPWDSEYNRQFHDQMPKIYRCGSIKQNCGEENIQNLTNYCVILGPDSFFDNSGKGMDLLKLRRDKPERDLMRMVLVTERNDLVCWMRPDDERRQEEAMTPYDSKRRSNDPPIRICESRHFGGFQATLFDGSAIFINGNIEEKERAEFFQGISVK